MILNKNIFLVIVSLFLPFSKAKAQLLTNLGEDHHNQIFIGSGYTESFANVTYGINHTRFFKILKRDVTGILDFTSPLSHQYFTRFIFRKGFQVDVYKRKNFRLPIALVTSSVKKELYLFAFHDIITDLYILPGVYKEKYTVAADLSLKILLLHRIHHNQSHIDSAAKLHRINVSLGIVLARNYKRFSFIFRGGFQQISDWEVIKAPVYAIGTVAFKFSFKKHEAAKKEGPPKAETTEPKKEMTEPPKERE